MIHALLIITQDGIGHVVHDEGMGINFTLFSGMLMSLNKFLTQIFGKEHLYREIELGRYTLLLKDTDKGLWVCIHDVSDNMELMYSKLDDLVKLLERKVDFEKELKAAIELDDKTKKKIESIINVKVVPQALQSFIDKEIKWLSEGRMINIILENVYLVSLEGGIAASWEKETKPDLPISYACLNMLKSVPNKSDLKIEFSSRHEAGTEEWRLRRIGNSEFFLFIRAVMNEGSKALFEILVDRIILGLENTLKKKGPAKQITEPSALLPTQKPLTILKERKEVASKKWDEIPKDEELIESLETLVQKVAKRIEHLSAIEELNEED
ncbi:MAG: hypothetical protein ACUVXA_09425 [Candidatus Jordarchaeum sp.]|uniref:hypothetical protein n=1 Tax=Candidatus Jordarchaeum sp. TaxID=2823881 RepID=UPI00404B4F71